MKSSTSDFLTDVQTVNIVIKQIGPNESLPTFKRIVERCSRQRVIQVSDNPRRLFHCSFIQSSSYTEFSELQQHRRVFAVIGVAFTNGHGEPDRSTRASRESTDSEMVESEQIANAYTKLKADNPNIICGRCILIGGKDEDFNEIERHERLCFASLEEATQLESADVHDKFTFARCLEHETVMRAIMYLIFEREYIKLEQFHRDYTGKYLDDKNTFMNNRMKAQICLNSAAMYKEIGFLRKQAFHARLSVLFELQVAGQARQASDYRNVYPVLFKTLEGYGVDLAEPHDMKNKKIGPVKLQIMSIHEIFTAANRAGHCDAAIRHICFSLQVYYPHLGSSMTTRLFNDLENLVRATPIVHQLNQTLVVDDGKIIIPRLQLTRFPMIQKPTVLALQPNLAPTIVPSKCQASIFIYSPFAKKADNALLWVTDCPGEVEVTVKNCRNVELVVRDLCLIVEGVGFEPVEARLILPPEDQENNSGSTIRLLGVPKEPGDLFITGYSCNIFGHHNECRFISGHNQKSNKIRVKVLPKLAKVYLECSLPRAPIQEENDEPSAEAVVFTGHKSDHTITVVNDSDIPVRYCGVKIWQPVVQGGPPLIGLEQSDADIIRKTRNVRGGGDSKTKNPPENRGELEKVKENRKKMKSGQAQKKSQQHVQNGRSDGQNRLLTEEFSKMWSTRKWPQTIDVPEILNKPVFRSNFLTSSRGWMCTTVLVHWISSRLHLNKTYGYCDPAYVALPDAARRIQQVLNVDGRTHVLSPYCTGLHWVLLNVSKDKVVYYDPKHLPPDDHIAKVITDLGTPEVVELKGRQHPYQSDGYQCGVFVALMSLSYLINKPWTTAQARHDVPAFRRRFLIEMESSYEVLPELVDDSNKTPTLDETSDIELVRDDSMEKKAVRDDDTKNKIDATKLEKRTEQPVQQKTRSLRRDTKRSLNVESLHNAKRSKTSSLYVILGFYTTDDDVMPEKVLLSALKMLRLPVPLLSIKSEPPKPTRTSSNKIQFFATFTVTGTANDEKVQEYLSTHTPQLRQDGTWIQLIEFHDENYYMHLYLFFAWQFMDEKERNQIRITGRPATSSTVVSVIQSISRETALKAYTSISQLARKSIAQTAQRGGIPFEFWDTRKESSAGRSSSPSDVLENPIAPKSNNTDLPPNGYPNYQPYGYQPYGNGMSGDRGGYQGFQGIPYLSGMGQLELTHNEMPSLPGPTHFPQMVFTNCVFSGSVFGANAPVPPPPSTGGPSTSALRPTTAPFSIREMEVLYKEADFTQRGNCDSMVRHCSGDTELALKMLKQQHLIDIGLADNADKSRRALESTQYDLRAAANLLLG